MAIAAVFTLARFSEAFLVLRARRPWASARLVPAGAGRHERRLRALGLPRRRAVRSDRSQRTRARRRARAAGRRRRRARLRRTSVAGARAGVVLWGLHMGLTQGLLATLVADYRAGGAARHRVRRCSTSCERPRPAARERDRRRAVGAHGPAGDLPRGRGVRGRVRGGVPGHPAPSRDRVPATLSAGVIGCRRNQQRSRRLRTRRSSALLPSLLAVPGQLPHEDRHLQRQRHQRPPARAAALARRVAARRRLPAGAEGARREVPGRRRSARRATAPSGTARRAGTASPSSPGARSRVETRRGLPGDPDDTHSRYIEAAVDGVIVGCLYLPNGNPRPGPKFDYKLTLVRAAHRPRRGPARRAAARSSSPATTTSCPTELDVYKPERWVDDALFRPEVREALPPAARPGLDGRAAAPASRTSGSTPSGTTSGTPAPATPACASTTCCSSPTLAPRLKAAGVDRDVRGMEKASDHAPTWIELADED